MRTTKGRQGGPLSGISDDAKSEEEIERRARRNRKGGVNTPPTTLESTAGKTQE
jgi:hypothetical protein